MERQGGRQVEHIDSPDGGGGEDVGGDSGPVGARGRRAGNGFSAGTSCYMCMQRIREGRKYCRRAGGRQALRRTTRTVAAAGQGTEWIGGLTEERTVV